MLKDRPKISVYIATSIDGYIARKDNSLDWLDRVGGFDEDYGFEKHFNSIDTLIIGRKTYEVATTVPEPYAGKRVVVLSNTLNSIRNGMELYKGDLRELVIKLHKEGTKHIWVDGGSTLSQFLTLQLVDTMILSIIPVILGSGLSLFNQINKEIPCRLLSSRSYSSGLVQLSYEIVKQFKDTKDKIFFKTIAYESQEYKKSITLCQKVLGKPFEKSPTQDGLEKKSIHIAGFLGQELCATAVLIPEQNKLKIQRIAIKNHFQNKGIGTALMTFCEKYAQNHGYELIYCHSKKAVIPFYLKSGYTLEGNPFNENGISYHKMQRFVQKSL